MKNALWRRQAERGSRVTASQAILVGCAWRPMLAPHIQLSASGGAKHADHSQRSARPARLKSQIRQHNTNQSQGPEARDTQPEVQRTCGFAIMRTCGCHVIAVVDADRLISVS